jgi:catechol 2,3-dioxygenase-like lactoylglutathione lyase family enzyme
MPLPSVSPAYELQRLNKGALTMEMKLEVLVIPVSDVDRAKRFYEKLGFRLDIDSTRDEDYRIIEFTPPGSGASIIFGKGITSAQPGSVDRLVLSVSDINATRAKLLSQGVAVSELFHDEGGSLGGGFHKGTQGRAPGPDPQRRSYGTYASFSDPDGNVWILQEITKRQPGRVDSPAFGSAGELASALRRAEAAHGKHEAQLGKRDENWPDWYAEYMLREQSGEESAA